MKHWTGLSHTSANGRLSGCLRIACRTSLTLGCWRTATTARTYKGRGHCTSCTTSGCCAGWTTDWMGGYGAVRTSLGTRCCFGDCTPLTKRYCSRGGHQTTAAWVNRSRGYGGTASGSEAGGRRYKAGETGGNKNTRLAATFVGGRRWTLVRWTSSGTRLEVGGTTHARNYGYTSLN